jgi:hypothetical protein
MSILSLRATDIAGLRHGATAYVRALTGNC